MSEATQPGAEPDVHAQILSILNKPKAEAPKADPSPGPTDEAANQQEADPPAEQEPAGDKPQDDAKDGEGPQLELSHVAAVLGIDEALLDVGEDGKSVILKAKVDGKEITVKAQDLIKSYQLEGHLNKQNMEVVEQRKALEKAYSDFQQQSAEKLQQVGNALHLAAIELNAEFQGINWQHLEATDPNEYTRQRLKFQDRQNRIEAANQLLVQHQVQQMQARRESELARLFEKVPEWKEPKALESVRSEMFSGLSEYGFSPEEVGSAIDHRLLVLARDALAYRKLQAAKAETAKKVVAAPKIVKPGAPSEVRSEAAKLGNLKSKISPNGEGLTDYLLKSGVARSR